MSQNSSFCSRCKNPVFTPRINANTAELYTKLRSEYGTAFEMQEVQEMLLLSDRDLEDYESEIIRLKSQILYVEAQKKRLIDYKQRLRSLLSPTRRLPNETLGRIFEFACDENLFQERHLSTRISPSLLSRLPALAISTVCTRWRSLAISSPSLWSKIRLKIRSDALVTSGQLSTLELYWERSAQLPLFIDVHVQGLQPPSLEFLTRHSRRWKSFKYRGDCSLSNYQDFPQLHFPILEDLNLRQKNPECFHDSPKLCSLTAQNLKGALLWNRVTSLDIFAPTRARMASILDQCPNLITVKLWQRSANGSYSNLAATPHRLSDKVRSLTLVPHYKVDEDFMETILSSHTFPSLNELHVVAGKNSTNGLIWPEHAFNGFVARSLCSITSLSIHWVRFYDSDVITAFRLLPCLLEVSLAEEDGTSLITSRLISTLHGGLDEQSSSGSPLLPKLRSLSLNVGGTAFDDAAFVSMASSRWLPDPDYAEVVGVSCLRSVLLRFRARKVDEEVYMPLQYLDKMGMRVVIIGI